MNDLDEYFTYWTKTKTQQYVFRNIRHNDNIHTKAQAMGAVLLTYLLQCLKYIRIWKENRYTNIFFILEKACLQGFAGFHPTLLQYDRLRKASENSATEDIHLS